MSHTRHMHSRMNHRGITQDLVDLTLEYGTVHQDRHVLGRGNLKRLLSDLQSLERTVKRALDKGGMVVVGGGGQLITAYSADSYDRRQASRS